MGRFSLNAFNTPDKFAILFPSVNMEFNSLQDNIAIRLLCIKAYSCPKLICFEIKIWWSYMYHKIPENVQTEILVLPLSVVL